MDETGFGDQGSDEPIDASERPVLDLLAAFNRGDREVFSPLMDLLSARFEALMATVLHKSFQRLSDADSPIGTQTLAQEVRVRIHKGIHSGSIAAIKDIAHFMHIASRNARWVLLDRIRELDRKQRNSQESNPFAQRFVLLLEDWKTRLDGREIEVFAEVVQDCVERMPDQLKQVFNLRFYLTNRAAAEHLGLKPTTALGRWNMAIDWLDKCLHAKFSISSNGP